MGNVAASMLVLSVVVWMALAGSRPPALIHATAAIPRFQAREPGGSPYLEVYREKLAIGSIYWAARMRLAGGGAPASGSVLERNHVG